MAQRDVFLFTESAPLKKRCAGQLSAEFSLVSDSALAYAHLLNMTNIPGCVLMDWQFCGGRPLLEVYDYIANTLRIPFVFLHADDHAAMLRKRRLFPHAYFADSRKDDGSLRALLQTIVYRFHSGEKFVASAQREMELAFFPDDGQLAPGLRMEAFNKKILRIAESDEPVLLLGESGSGKSYTARRIHRASRFCGGPFCSMNVAELSSGIAESQLFGTVRGAFTDAHDAPGLFEQAQKGTLLLDEIAELDLAVQSKLLDVIETRRFRRVGSMTERRFSTRLIFATNADLHALAREGRFRQDLLYRMDVLSVRVPPLREHKEDIPSLAREFASERHRQLSDSAVERLMAYSWPGNIRQLGNYLSRACALSRHETLTADDFDFMDEGPGPLVRP